MYAKTEEVSSADLVKTILQGGKPADEAMCDLLYRELDRRLRRLHEPYRHQLLDTYEDLVGDFFLYLREGKEGREQVPYASLRRISRQNALEGWLLHTFRNFLSSRVAGQPPAAAPLSPDYQSAGSDLGSETDTDSDSDASPLTDERKLDILSTLIAYGLQTFSPRHRFIFLRMLLTLLDKPKAMPNRQVAQALGISEGAYRVATSRVRSDIVRLRNSLLQGIPLPLDETHRQMAVQINENYHQLYPLLLSYYQQTIGELKRPNDIRQLRRRQTESGSILCHESEPTYHRSISVSNFWLLLEQDLRSTIKYNGPQNLDSSCKQKKIVLFDKPSH